MKRYLNSTYLKKKNLPAGVNRMLSDDLALFNKMKRAGFAALNRDDDFKMSFHVDMRDRFGVSDYFMTAVAGAVKETRSSQKELLGLYIDDINADIAEMEEKIEAISQKRTSLMEMKKSIIAYTKDGKKNFSLIRNFKSSGISFKEDGSVQVGMPGHFTVYENIWLFEHGYLEPRIRRLGTVISSIRAAIRRKEQKAASFQGQLDRKRYSVYFGSRKLMKADIPESQREKEIRKKRECSMTLSGRKDAANGNFMVRYDPVTHALSYRGSRKSGEYTKVGEVLFPYGQELVDKNTSDGGAPVAWTVVDCGNAWRFDACLTLPDGGRENGYYGDGCIGIDINWDRIAVMETDGAGNPLARRVIPLDLSGSSEQNKQNVSLALESVFAECREKHKPLGAEDIGNVKRKAKRYGGDPKRNRHISLFASRMIRQLLESKSFKYGIAVCFINPAYTSQTGKVKYMRRYGLGVHESAALVIARRALGIIDRVPAKYRPKMRKPRPRLSQWKRIYKETKGIRPADMFKKAGAGKKPEGRPANEENIA